MDAATLKARALAWRDEDPDPACRALIDANLEDASWLNEHFGQALSFGTAGIRGKLGPGPGAMNQAWVRRVAAGLSAHLKRGQETARVVLGHDARIGSRVFAEDIARVLGGAGHHVFLYDMVVTTPELAHAVVHMEATAGVMVTASHNPPQDNGVKVYDETGAQIVPPTDTMIAHAIAQVIALSDVVTPPLDSLRAEGLVCPPPPEARETWLQAALDVVVAPSAPRASCPLVYTAMHGVAGSTVLDLLGRGGFSQVHVVDEQQAPDGQFPTVRQPNPQDPSALKMAMAHADEQGVNLILANDPDGDRLAVAVRTPDGAWHPLTGDAVGVLLADDLLTHSPKNPPRCVASSIVSTSMLDAIAHAHDAERLTTLTGFKWIARAGLQAEAEGKRYVLGFEEAIGYNAGLKVRDKDGVTAALLVADLAARLAHQDRSLLDQLDTLYRTHGYYLTTQRSFRREGAKGQATLQEAMRRLRTQAWEQVADVPVEWVRDLKSQTRSSPGQPVLEDTLLPVADVLEVGLTDGSRALIRPSGTEPKLKIYAETRQPWPADEAAQDVRRAAAARATRLLDALTVRLGLDVD